MGWLPMMERRDWHLLIATFKALNDLCWPEYASLKRYNPGRSGLWSCSQDLWETPVIKDTFQYFAAKCFNNLPHALRTEKNLEYFVMRPKHYILNGQGKDWESH